MKSLLVVALTFMLSSCGVVYISPKVSEEDGKVQIVPMTAQSVQTANSTPYDPKELPSVFFANAGGPSAGRGIGATPPLSVERENRPETLTLNPPPQVPSQPYTIGVGDVLLLATRGNASTVEQLSGLLAAQNRRQGYTVQDDGSIAIPEVGRVAVAGRTLEEAEAALFQRLVENQIDPSFSVEIAEFNSKRVAIGGAVAQPTVVPITLTTLTLDQAMSAAGGIATEDLDYASIRVYRNGTLYQIPLQEYLKRPNLQKLRLTDGDSIFVDTEYQLGRAQAYFAEQIALAQFKQTARTQALAELQAEVNLRRAALEETRSNFRDRIDLDGVDRDYVYLGGEVSEPSRFPLPFGRQATLADALYSEGGFPNQTGNPAQIYVLRGTANSANPDMITAWHLDARNAANFVLATKFLMRPNDIIFVAEQPISRWNRAIQQSIPSIVTSGARLVD